MGPNVHPETRAAVEASLTKLKYSPNLAARALAGGDQVRVGVLYGNPSVASPSEFLVGCLEQARVSCVALVMKKCGVDQNDRDVVRALLAAGIDGIILAPPLCDSEPLHRFIRGVGVPAVAVASATPRAGFVAVRIDNRAVARAMTRHILALGHRRVGFIVGSPDRNSSAQRLAGYVAALAEAGFLPMTP